jgi:hypothetical protein
MAALAALLTSLSLAVPSFGQMNTGTITGTVTDPQGATVANVKVTAVHIDTNFETRVATNSEGLYRVQALQPGLYRLTFESAGFKRVVQSGLDLRSGDVLPVNVRMELGQLADSIQVSAQSTLLETETSAAGSLTEGETLYKMPLYQRYVLNALNLNPGMTQNGYSYGGSLGGFNVAGQRSTGTAVFEDGVFGNDPVTSTGTDIKPVENSVDEVKVLTGTYPRVWSHHGGGGSGQEGRHHPCTDGRRPRSHTRHDPPPVFQHIQDLRSATGSARRRAGVVHAAGCQHQRAGGPPAPL